MSRSYGRATAQNFPELPKNLEKCMRNLKMYVFNFSSCFFLNDSQISCDFRCFLPLFLAQNFRTKVLTAQKKSTFRMSIAWLYRRFVLFYWHTRVAAVKVKVNILLNLSPAKTYLVKYFDTNKYHLWWILLHWETYQYIQNSVRLWSLTLLTPI